LLLFLLLLLCRAGFTVFHQGQQRTLTGRTIAKESLNVVGVQNVVVFVNGIAHHAVVPLRARAFAQSAFAMATETKQTSKTQEHEKTATKPKNVSIHHTPPTTTTRHHTPPTPPQPSSYLHTSPPSEGHSLFIRLN